MYNETVAARRSCVKIHCSYQHYQAGKITSQVSVLMIEYFFATSYELWINNAIFVVLMNVAVEIVIEKSSICVWEKVGC